MSYPEAPSRYQFGKINYPQNTGLDSSNVCTFLWSTSSLSLRASKDFCFSPSIARNWVYRFFLQTKTNSFLLLLRDAFDVSISFKAHLKFTHFTVEWQTPSTQSSSTLTCATIFAFGIIKLKARNRLEDELRRKLASACVWNYFCSRFHGFRLHCSI